MYRDHWDGKCSKVDFCVSTGMLLRKYNLHSSSHWEYAVKAQTSLALLSRFRGSHITTAHEQQCCRFQSYAKTVPSRMKLTSEIDKAWTTFLGSTTTDHGLWRLTLTAYSWCSAWIVKGEVQSRITIISKESIKISLQIGAKMMKIG